MWRSQDLLYFSRDLWKNFGFHPSTHRYLLLDKGCFTFPFHKLEDEISVLKLDFMHTDRFIFFSTFQPKALDTSLVSDFNNFPDLAREI